MKTKDQKVALMFRGRCACQNRRSNKNPLVGLYVCMILRRSVCYFIISTKLSDQIANEQECCCTTYIQ